MDNISYIGETLWPGSLGHFCIVLGFVAALIGVAAYAMQVKTDKTESTDQSWRFLGRFAYIIHSVSTFAIIGLLFYMMGSKMYEYNYVFNQVSDDLQDRYIFSAFWGGQEGSFLLWMFWHCVLGLILCFKSGEWEAPVMAVLSSIEVFLSSMLLGVYLPWGESQTKIGSSPASLFRDVMDAPIFANADYLSMIQGRGLNPLLQNYWMTIHPPTLFLGFASVAIPFCFAIAGLWTGKHKEWLAPALKWSLFSCAIFGTGILMGAAWAYEALSFGGYWAWDPVENASLVPWLFLLAGLHTNLIANVTGHSIRATYLLYLLGFIFVIYSTFLTRSGILGDTSAHAFTEMGLEWQLAGFVGFFVLLGAYFLVKNFKSIPAPVKEEKFTSKEFWMYIGSIVLFFSGVLIIGATSLPVFNKIYTSLVDPEFAGYVITNPEEHYNRYQLWIGVFIGLISGAAQFLRYRALNWEKHKTTFYKEILISGLVAALLSFLAVRALFTINFQYSLLMFAGIFTLVSNLYFLFVKGKGNKSLVASAVSHAGFGIMVVGILFSGINKSYVTSNQFAMKGLVVDESLRNHVTLLKGEKMFSKGYWMTYHGDTLSGNVRTYDISFVKVDEENQPIEKFDLKPTTVYTNDFTKIAANNPSTNHYFNKDIFLTVSGMPKHLQDVQFAKEMEDTLRYNTYSGKINNWLVDPLDGSATDMVQAQNDTFNTERNFGMIRSLTFDPKNEAFDTMDYDLVLGVNVTMMDSTGSIVEDAQPALALKGGLIYQYPAHIDNLNMRLQIDENFFSDIFTQEGKLEYQELQLKEGQTIKWNGYDVTLNGFNRTPEHNNYEAEEGDIAIAANLDFRQNGQLKFTAKPIFVIRDNQRFSIKDYMHVPGVHTRFSNIDPASGQMEFMIGQDIREFQSIPLVLAENVPRSDYISIEGIVFPFINLVWIGCIMMMLGLTIGLFKRFGKMAV